MLRRRKKRAKKSQPETEEARSKAIVSASEKAYLDQLEKMIKTPGQTPYVRRQGPKAQQGAAAPGTEEPVFDSGPMSPEEVQGRAAGALAAGRLQSTQARPQGRVRLGSDGIYEMEIDVPSADLEQYDDVKPKPPPKPKPAPPPRAEEKPPPQPAPAPEPEVEKSKDLFPCGTLVVWNDGELAVYKQHREEKGYDVIYVAESGGKLVPKGVCLFAYGPRRVGQLSEAIFQWMERTMSWSRDAFVAHFDNPADAGRIPVLGEAPAAGEAPEPSKPAADTEERGPFVRGRTFTISMGDHVWHGVYWGRDPIGTLVAHNTNRVWTLMHLDLDRFGSDVQLGDVLPDEAITSIEQAVNGQG